MAGRHIHLLLLMSVPLAGPAAGGCGAGQAPVDLGDFERISKADEMRVVEVPFEVAPGEPMEFSFRTTGLLSVRVHQDASRSRERLQLVASSAVYRRRSWRGRSPFLDIPAGRGGDGLVDYRLQVIDWGTVPARGTLVVTTEIAPPEGVAVVFNQPDCENCDDPAGGLREEVLRAIQGARESIDMAVYGLDDPAVSEALCNAIEAGVAVRAITGDESADDRSGDGYWRSYFSEADGLAGCGALVETVHSDGIMHHKFLLIDAGTPEGLLITGSTNLTEAGFDRNHNNMVFVRGMPELEAAYRAELEQLLGHCTLDRLDDRRSCAECTPGCTEDRSDEGPWPLPHGEGELEAYFSPSDDALRVLRGAAEEIYLDAPDPACDLPGADCVCRRSGDGYRCAYCALGEDGYGLLQGAEDRVLVSMFSVTDQCVALGMVRAAERGVAALAVFDHVKGASPYSRDDYLCARGVATYIADWGDGSALVHNHNKIVVVDDTVFDGSMNLSRRGVEKNNENALVIRSGRVAEVFGGYVQAEAALLERRGVWPRNPAACVCHDLVDNDGDGAADGDDPDCDAGF